MLTLLPAAALARSRNHLCVVSRRVSTTLGPYLQPLRNLFCNHCAQFSTNLIIPQVARGILFARRHMGCIDDARCHCDIVWSSRLVSLGARALSFSGVVLLPAARRHTDGGLRDFADTGHHLGVLCSRETGLPRQRHYGFRYAIYHID